MRLLFSVNNFGFLRNFEPALRLLAARGHDLHLLAERTDSVGGTRTIENLVSAHPGRITYGYAASRKDEFWQPLAVQLRLALDYWRYLDGRYDNSPSLRARAARQASALAALLPTWPVVGARPAMRLWSALVRLAERAMPPGAVAEAALREHRPDLVLLTPLLYFGSQQVEYVRAAKRLGVRTVLGVGSWDHLTTKGLIHEQPDRVIVWNEMQRTEAAELHGIPPARVTVTGAQAYDHWFTQQPALSREAFCARVGVPSDRPLLLYLCSSPFITPYEVGFVRRWIEAIRHSTDPELRRAAMLIRPHPQNAAQWRNFDPAAYDAVGIWPKAGANPVDAEARTEYFDSMYHSAAVIGVNTSALIESGIVGRPVYTVVAEEFSGQQEGTLHFQYLKNVNGGLLHIAATLSEHLDQLARAVRGEVDASRSRAFVEAFIRPHGFDRPAAERFVDAIELAAAAPVPALRATLATTFGRVLLMPLAALARASAHGRKERKDPRSEDRSPPGTTRILFALASPEFLRYYDSTIRLLADRGHHVSLAVNWLRERKHARLHLIDDPRIEVLGVVPKRGDFWTAFARAVRGTIDFVRYLHPRFADTPVLRDRMYRRVLPAPLRPLNRIRTMSGDAVRRTIRVLQALERAIPVARRTTGFLQAHRPDIVVVSPLVDAASDQVDLVRASQAAGIPAVLGVASWDNLTNKGHMRVQPDLVTVWNAHQKAEAIELHGIPAERIAVTGAQLFDRWFDRTPSQSRAAFCAMAGLPDDRPFVLFTGSSVFIARSEFEVPFVRRWIEALRASSDPVLRDAAVLVRPHPFNPDAWITADFSDLGAVAIWPRQRYTPAAEDARASFFDSLDYCAAVVGINTSAMIEASILRRPVLSLLTSEFARTQEGTLHFRYLLPENGGFLRVASSIEQHIGQLSEVLRNPDVTRQETERFVANFLRPHGTSTPCTPLLADAIERARTARHECARDGAGAVVLRVMVFPLAVGFWMFSGVYIRRSMARWRYEGGETVRRTGRRFVRTLRRVVRILRRLVRLASHAGSRLTRVTVDKHWRQSRLWLRRAQKRGRAVASRRGRAMLAAPRKVRRLSADAAEAGGSRLGVVAAMFERRRRPVLRQALARLPRHVKRGARHLRYHVAVRFRGAVKDVSRAMAHEVRTGRPLRILFSMRNFWFLRLFESVLRELAARGHHIHIVADRDQQRAHVPEVDEALASLASDCPNVTWSWARRDVEDDWLDARVMVRLSLDYLRFMEPGYAGAPVLAARARERTPTWLLQTVERPFWRSWPGRRLLTRVLRLVERAMPIDRELLAEVAESRADLALVTPLVDLGSEQNDFLRATRRLGIPTALCVGSWDHLSSKALIRTWPDRVFVWNEVQRREAIEFHSIPAHRVQVTGTQGFDVWFDRTPALDRDTFCRKVGLDPARPFVMYVCSALFEGSPNEAQFVLRWLETLRGSAHQSLRTAGVLIRPHPKRDFEWEDVDVSRLPGTTLWPPRAAAPLDADSKADYFDSLYHSAAIVGLNTSALIEGGIVGRPVHTVLLPEFVDNQEGTLHFRYLLKGGLLRAARDLTGHFEQLAASLDMRDRTAHQNRAFVEAFVRPEGLETPVTPAFADAVEEVANLPSRRQPERLWMWLVRRALRPYALGISGTFVQQAARERRWLEKQRAREAEQAEDLRLKQERIAARERAKLEEREATQRERMAGLRAREEAKVRAHAERERARAVARQQKLALRREREERRARAYANRVAARESEHEARRARAEAEKEAARQQKLERLAQHQAAKALARQEARRAQGASSPSIDEARKSGIE